MYDEESPEWVPGVRLSRSGAAGSEPILVGPGRTGPARDLRRADRPGVRPRRACGPRPVRPAAGSVSVRPAQGERPAPRPEPALRACRNRERVLVRPVPAVPWSTAGPGRRLRSGLLVVLLAAAVVIGLGQLLALREPATAVPVAASPAAATVTVGAEANVWDLARRLEPGADGPRQAVLAERIAVANALTSVELRPGQVLLVPSR